MRHQFLRQLLISYVLIVILSAFIFVLTSLSSLSTTFDKYSIESTSKTSALISMFLSTKSISVERDSIFEFLDRIGKETGLSVLLISIEGEILRRSNKSDPLPQHHIFIPDIKSAIAGKAECYLSSEGVSTISCSTPTTYKDGMKGVVRVSKDLNFSVIAWEFTNRILIAVLTLLLVGILFTIWFSKRITYPFESLRAGAEKFAKGELDFRLYAPANDEMGRLARVLNKMAAQLQGRIKVISRNKNELDVVLASMKEGVIAISNEERVIKINNAACDMLDLVQGRVSNKSIEEVLRNISLQNFAKRALKEVQPQEDEILLHEKGQESIVRVYSRELLDGDGTKLGVLVALNDVTQLKRLENIRRDFVANVSHELKTPITSIKGFVETLIDGAINQPEEARRFLNIIKRQVDRLNEIFDDLLSLAHLEEEEREGGLIEKSNVLARIICANVIQTCDFKAKEKNIVISLEIEEEIQVSLNPSLAEQAIVNLLDNAIKYSGNSTVIRLVARQDERFVYFDIIDQGPGIEASHLERIFERFYRIDPGRSRQHGGTGLGLAIVKHIGKLHGGSVSVKSEPSRGSTFTISFPK